MKCGRKCFCGDWEVRKGLENNDYLCKYGSFDMGRNWRDVLEG